MSESKQIFSLGEDVIYWYDSRERALSKIGRDLAEQELIIPAGLMGVEGLAVDWIAGIFVRIFRRTVISANSDYNFTISVVYTWSESCFELLCGKFSLPLMSFWIYSSFIWIRNY